jgi:ATP-binding cassette subfamily C protein
VLNARLRDAQDAAARPTVVSAALLRALRPSLQSAMLSLGAYLVMTGACHPAEMLAASILLARALGPLETAIAHWRCLAAARDSAAQLYALLSAKARAGATKTLHGRVRYGWPRANRSAVEKCLRAPRHRR